MHRSTDWYVYDGTLGAPVATELRGACSCGWRGTPRYLLDWEAVERRNPYPYDTSGPEGDWDAHINDVQARTVSLPVDLTALLDQVETRLTALITDEPLAAIRAAATLERMTQRVAEDAVYSLDTADGPEWDTVAQALGVSRRGARSRLTRYVLRR
ncbi:hypothetical protein OOK13_30345 [Streptomyces sp. NBC_00378]|uniref:hypothetical protein n=1 Tax=unclassified Streptomyces TaxID=2593676 RepID=UPI00225AEA77|nr:MULTISPECIES: hypothetical protein [unclassified Streptomyces]MCX5112687.1 hypothetical protein [Streptomyces sp. NBC_00378]